MVSFSLYDGCRGSRFPSFMQCEVKSDVVGATIHVSPKASLMAMPIMTIPVSAGRNLAAIVELAAMNNRQKKHGFNSAREFAAQIDGHIDRVTRENEAKKQNP